MPVLYLVFRKLKQHVEWPAQAALYQDVRITVAKCLLDDELALGTSDLLHAAKLASGQHPLVTVDYLLTTLPVSFTEVAQLTLQVRAA